MSIRIAILDDYADATLRMADWSLIQQRAHVDVYCETLRDEDAVAARLEPYSIICTMRERTPFPASLISKLPNLRLLTTTSSTNRAIDLQAANDRGIVVAGTKWMGNTPVEHTWALILATARHLVQEDANVKGGNTRWQTTMPLGLMGRTLGLLGAGRLGQATAKIAKEFGMRIIAWSPNLTPERAAAAGVEFASSKEELLRESDILSIHIILSPSTRHLLTADDLALMKPSAFLINTSRGPIVEESALVDALQRQSIAGAGLDVFDIEPLPLDHPIRWLPNVTLSPHMGYVNDISFRVSTP
ncbi:D-isomer specific 2-hydroxyacid dehydrogenase [Auricularia subglabra TFB-10046 SS5]|nr:D-isomer specific 2-hydroxyacid dehydrogenase [Auricularia subglabra TFB-10046 SS5]